MSRLLAIASASCLLLAACSDPKFDESSQTGPNPALPDPKQFLLPPINVAPGEGWPAGKTPIVAAGLRIKALATGLQHPRFVYVLPNGDILAVQAKSPPPEPVKHRMRPTMFAGPVGIFVSTTRLLPLAVQEADGPGLVR